ncbi:hypothetical protein F5141DRAFT_1264312 [Pisolithus sp. B1]|nr:hypothetical protein F5141DRAFT_1264312 [Pisolithus sp. B1]
MTGSAWDIDEGLMEWDTVDANEPLEWDTVDTDSDDDICDGDYVPPVITYRQARLREQFDIICAVWAAVIEVTFQTRSQVKVTASPRPGTSPHSASVHTPASSNSNNEPFPDSNTSSQIPSIGHSRFSVRASSRLRTSSARLQCKQSRSSSRRPKSVARGSNSDGVYQAWYISPNTHCNGGLEIAVDSAKGRFYGLVSSMQSQTHQRPSSSMRAHLSSSIGPSISVSQTSSSKITTKATSSGSMTITFASGLLRPPPKTVLAPVGFFLHVAFPSSEIFCGLSARDSPPKAVLGADLVGFQTANYARHFRQTVSCILAYESLPKGTQVEGPSFSLVPVVKPSGGQCRGKENEREGAFRGCWCVPDRYRCKLREEKRNSEVQYRVQLLRQRYAGMKLIVGRDKLDEIQGVRHKIEALEHFLKANPEFQGREVTFSQYLALPTVADAFMVTSLREGIRSGEVIPVKHGSSDRGRTTHLAQYQRPLPLLLAFDVLPRLFYQALTMPDEEAASRWQDLHNHVITETAETFATFLPRCLRAHTEHVSLSIDPSLVPLLDPPPLITKYRHSTTHLVFVDLEGACGGRGPMFEPPEATMRVLERMVGDPMNEIWVLSGLPVKGALEETCGESPKHDRDRQQVQWTNGMRWISMVANLGFAWKGPCVKISTTSPTGRQAPSSRSALHISCGDSGRVSRIPLSRLKMIILSPPLPATLLLLPRTQLHHYPHPNPTIPTAAALVVNLPKHRITSSIPSKSDMVSALSLVKISLSCWHDLDDSETVLTSGRETDAKWKFVPREVLGVLEMLVQADEDNCAAYTGVEAFRRAPNKMYIAGLTQRLVEDEVSRLGDQESAYLVEDKMPKLGERVTMCWYSGAGHQTRMAGVHAVLSNAVSCRDRLVCRVDGVFIYISGAQAILKSEKLIGGAENTANHTLSMLAVDEQLVSQKGNFILIVPPEHGQAVHTPGLQIHCFHDNTGPQEQRAERLRPEYLPVKPTTCCEPVYIYHLVSSPPFALHQTHKTK